MKIIRHTAKLTLLERLQLSRWPEKYPWLAFPLLIVVLLCLFPIMLVMWILDLAGIRKLYAVLFPAREKPNAHAEKFNNLPIKLKFLSIYQIDNWAQLMDELGVSYHDTDELDFGQFTSDPSIPSLDGKFFNWNIERLGDKLILVEIILPDFHGKLGILDCHSWEIQHLMDLGPEVNFETSKKDGEISIKLLREGIKTKEVITISE